MPNNKTNNRWNCYVGITTESTNHKNQRWFHIFCPELLPFKQGDITMEEGVNHISIENIFTKSVDVADIKTTATVYADYFNITTSLDVPTMNRGMQVLVLNYANTDKYYWVPLERDDSLRTFEHHRLSCLDVAQANKRDLSKKPDDIESKDKSITDDNCYYMEIDTRYHKHIFLSTSNTDGEAWRYFMKIDANTHTFEIWDVCTDGSQDNNVIKLESRPGMDIENKGRITLQTAGGATLVLNSEDGHLTIPRNFTIDIGGDLLTQVKGKSSTIIQKDRLMSVVGNTLSAINGTKTEAIAKDYKETCLKNKTVTITEEHTETQKKRTTKSEDATWTTKTYKLISNTTQLSIGKVTIIAETCNYKGALTIGGGTVKIAPTVLSLVYGSGTIKGPNIIPL